MSAPGGPPDRTGRHLARYDVPVPRTRAPKPVPIDLDALDEFNAGVERAKAAYYGTTTYYEARNAQVAKTLRYRARKDAS